MRRLLLFLLFLLLVPSIYGATALPIKVSSNHRYFTDANGVPWMMVGDSAHTAICNLAQSAWNAYFQDRQNQGFNTIDLLALDAAGTCASSGAAKDGTLPFTSGTGPSSYDLSTPNSAFWTEVDNFINQAASSGLVVSIDPMAWGNGFAVTYQNNGATKVFNFGVFLGNRYKNSPNIIWHMGQDFDKGSFPSSTNLNLMAQLMAGVKSVDTNHIVTCQLNYTKSYSNQAISSNSTFATNLDFDFVYTYFEVYDYVLQSYASSNVNPTILGETNYETGNNTGALSSPANDFITRQELWYAMTSGAAGHIFGNEHVNHFDASYLTNLDTVATGQVKFLSGAMAALPWWTFIPDNPHTLVTAGFGTYNGSNGNMYNATYASAAWDGANYAVVYTPVATTLTVNMAKFAHGVTASWYDPTKGSYQPIAGSPFSNSGTQNFTTPGTNSTGASDWVLVMATSAVCANVSTCNVPALDVTTVQNSLNSVNTDGAQLNFPVGSSTWTTRFTYNQVFSITMSGKGNPTGTSSDGLSNPTGYNDQTVLLDNVADSNTAGQLFAVNTASGKTFRVTGMTFQTSPSQSVQAFHGILSFAGGSTSFRFDHNHVSVTFGTQAVDYWGAIQGVIDHNRLEVTNTTNVNLIEVQGSGYKGLSESAGGDQSWTDSANFGTQSFMFMENNSFAGSSAHSFDCQFGGRGVFRFNSMNNTVLQTHGTGFDTRDRGCRAVEMYGNTSAFGSPPFSFWIQFESGSTLIWNNTVSGVSNFVEFDAVRTNNATYSQTAPLGGWGYCGTSVTGVTSVWDQNLSTDGHECLDGVGAGKGDLLTGGNGGSFTGTVDSVTGTQTWPNQASEPAYVWGNSVSGLTGNYGFNFSGDLTTAQNRDYYLELPNFNNASAFTGVSGIGCGPAAGVGCTNPVPQPTTCTVGVGYWNPALSTLFKCASGNVFNAYYTPFTYPHPLITGGGSPAVGLSPSNLSYANQLLLTTSSSQSVTLTNSGTAALTITSISVAGTNSSSWSQSNNCGSSVVQGANCTITVTFSPITAGALTASVSIVTNAPTSPNAISLTGFGMVSIITGKGSISGSAIIKVNP